MYLQSLEISGFKSFAARTLLEFHRGVTAVVGPNGCGKSNVLDAIRWVLGEQSAKALRGGEMADVIFSGTDSRKPLGMAEVSLTFSECEKELGVEWNEVRITRRVFRDGKSEYLINRTPCRLRDIHHLFMDTGIGRSAYSIMEQGKIDQILSSKPEDRRAIFEEAAGITKYKAQKKEALRKLDYTEANLLRVSDIIKEVKRQIGSLQRQAGKARRYQSLLESLRTFDTHLSHRKFSEFADELEKIKSDLLQLEDSKKAQEEQIVTQEQEITNHRSQLGAIDAEISQVRDTVQTLNSRVVAAESRIESHQHRQMEFSELITRNEADIIAAKAKTEEQENQIQQTDRQIEELINTLRTGEEALTGQDARLQAVRSERQGIEQSLLASQQEVSRLEGELGRVRSEMATANAQSEAAEARLAMLHGEYASAQAAQQEVDARVGDHEAHIASLASQLEEARAQATQLQERLQEVTASKQAIESETSQLDRKLTELRSRLEVLRQLEAAGEGLGEATQSLLRGLDNPDFFQPSVSGALANLIDVDPQYVPAVEAALGSVLQGVVFKDPSVAEAALLTLAKGENGRGAVLARGWMPQEQNSPFENPLPEGCLAWASSVIQAQSELGQFLNTFLKHVAIVSDLQTAIHLRQSHPRLSFATLGGDLLTKEGVAYSGKSQSGASSALLRKTEITNLSAEINELSQKHTAVQERLQMAALELEDVNASLAESRQRQQDLQLEFSSAQQEQNLFQRQREDASKRIEQFQQEIERLNQQSETTRSQTRDLESRVSEIASSQEATASQRLEFENKVQELRAREAEVGEELNELRIRVATERQQNDNLQRQREPMKARLEELAELVVQRGNDIENYRSRIEQFTSEVGELQGSIESWSVEQKQAEEQGHN
ncbi:MAG: chromosome segregation protein SMC, partial [Chthoniobacterales bacterium]